MHEYCENFRLEVPWRASFCGSATSGIAACCSGRKFIGIDVEKEYLDNIAIPGIQDQLGFSNWR
ncbi:MAG: hypothetical protein B0D92_08180 [Spirochaeta sp. LUC14_002_19_P3]|nr:MAG: hypothetical protein B0D92_08180 [Spirochaeta sp. LUC14_002_19_P3]